MRTWWLATIAVGAFACEGAIEPVEPTAPGSPVFPGGVNPVADPGSPQAVPTTVVPEPLHRLNRAEYNNTVRDLLGTSLRPASAFPPDTAVGGFDNAADALTLPASLFALYQDAAKTLAESTLRVGPRYLEQLDARPIGIETKLSGAAFENWGWSLAGPFVGRLTLPQAEQVTLSILVGGARTPSEAMPVVGLIVDGARLRTFNVTASPATPQTFTVAAALAKGAHTVQVTFDNRVNEPAENRGNQLVLGWVRAVSDAQSVPANRNKVYVCEPVGAAAAPCYERIVTTFAERAWRRPLVDEERVKLVAAFKALAATEGNDEAVMLLVRGLLVSPKFLFRPSFSAGAETPAAGQPQWVPLDAHVLASRLSYFLWSTMPDEALLADAASGALSTDEGLVRQVRRMLKAPKAVALRKGFASAWLGAKALESATPDPAAYPKFNDALKASMLEEPELFFGEFLQNGRPLTEMLTPDFVHVNDQLAAFYGRPIPRSGATFTKVRAAKGDRRGILMQAAWLTSSSDPTHTSPVRRGRWVLEQLFGNDIPPPPPGIPPLPTDASAGTVRERLAEHRANPSCAVCHNSVDPVGLGLEEFDGIGWRRALENGLPVDRSGAVGALTFDGAEEMAAIVAEDPRFVTTVVTKLHTYALGRAKVREDRPFVTRLERQLADEGLRLDALIELIVRSPTFRMTQAPTEGTP